MLASAVLLLACFWLLGRALRGALVGVQARWVTAGRPMAPFALTLRPVPSPAGEEVWYAAGASLWEPMAAGAVAPRLVRLGRWWTVALGGGRGMRRRVRGRERRAGGLVVVTSRRVMFRGTGRARTTREDVPLHDVAHLRLEGPLLVVERRSRPGAPMPLHLAAAGAVARLIQAAAAGASPRTAAATGPPRPGTAGPLRGY